MAQQPTSGGVVQPLRIVGTTGASPDASIPAQVDAQVDEEDLVSRVRVDSTNDIVANDITISAQL